MRRTLAAVGLLAAACLLGGCANPLVVDPAPYAADPTCATVMLAMPDALGGQAVRETSSQATSAYGEEFPIIVRCGVEPPGPTTDECLAIETRLGVTDWVLVDEDGVWRATAFGRSPALELVVPQELADEAIADVLAEVSGQAALAPSNGLECR